MKFYLTFGQQSPFRNGWVEIEASSYAEARKVAFDTLGNRWSMLYFEEEFKEAEMAYFPLGKIGETLNGM